MRELKDAMQLRTADAPTWLPGLQRAFSRGLLEPLLCDGKTFTVKATSRDSIGAELRDPKTLSANAPDASISERLELYQLQYWMRLFGTLQETFARLAFWLGHFRFNQLALEHLQVSPPTSFDLADLAPQFRVYLRQRLPALCQAESASGNRPSLQLLLQALAFDEAELRAFEAPWFPAWHPTPHELDALPRQRLSVAPSFSLLREDWPMAERPGTTETKVRPTPTQFSTSRYWVYSRTQWSIALCPVEPAFARLLHAVQTQPLEQAAAALSQRLNEAARGTLAQKLPQWIQFALEQSWWLGAQDYPATTRKSDTQV